jgi:hypothetical protein
MRHCKNGNQDSKENKIKIEPMKQPRLTQQAARTHLPMVESQPMMLLEIQECCFTDAPSNIVVPTRRTPTTTFNTRPLLSPLVHEEVVIHQTKKLSHQPSSMTQLGPMTTSGPNMQPLPIFALG